MAVDISKYASMYPYTFRSKHYIDATRFESRIEWYNWSHRRTQMMAWISDQRIDHWMEHEGVFMFSFEKDCIMFALRWE